MTPGLEKLLKRHHKLYKYSKEFSSSVKKLVNKTKEDTGVDKKIIDGIISAQFRMIKDTIMTSSNKEGLLDKDKFDEYKSIRLIYLGAFMPSKNKFDKLMKDLKEKENV